MALLASVIGEGGAWAQQLQPRTPPAESEVEYYHTDVLGSVRLVTNQTGQVVKRQDFTPYGKPFTDTPASDHPRGFAGKERDDQTGFDYFGGRYLLADASRFTTVDPVLDTQSALVDPQRWNRYTYVRNNPLLLVDPDGRCIWDACVGEVAAVLGVSYAAAAVVEAVAVTAVVLSPIGQRIATGIAETTASAVNAAVGVASAVVNGTRDSINEAVAVNRTQFPDQPLLKDEHGRKIPLPEAEGRAHSQIGQRLGRHGKHDQVREFDENGVEVRDIDFTDHATPEIHPYPHQHKAEPNPTGGTPRRGDPKPLEPPS